MNAIFDTKEVVLVLISAFFTWLISKRYYQKSKNDGEKSTNELKKHIDKSSEKNIKDGDVIDGGKF